MNKKSVKPLRVLYVSNDYYDPRNMRSWSGLPQFMARALEQQGVEMTYMSLRETIAGRVWHSARGAIGKLTGKRFLRDRTPGLLKSYARQIEHELAIREPDFLFCPGTAPIAYLNTKTPICFWVDATFAGMVNYYDSFSKLCGSSLRAGAEVDQAALDRAALALYSSEWAADTALRHYTVDPERVYVIPFGANLSRPPSDAEVEALIVSRGAEECRLFFAGVDWERKGANDAVRVLQALRQRSISARLLAVNRRQAWNCRKAWKFSGSWTREAPRECVRLNDYLATPTSLFYQRKPRPTDWSSVKLRLLVCPRSRRAQEAFLPLLRTVRQASFSIRPPLPRNTRLESPGFGAMRSI
jgi:hypothetical protein